MRAVPSQWRRPSYSAIVFGLFALLLDLLLLPHAQAQPPSIRAQLNAAETQFLANPQDAVALAASIELHTTLGQFAEAEALGRASSLHLENAEVMIALGAVLAHQTRFEDLDALALEWSAAQSHPRPQEALWANLSALRKAGHYGQARSLTLSALDARTDPDIAALYAQILIEEGFPAEAVTLLQGGARSELLPEHQVILRQAEVIVASPGPAQEKGVSALVEEAAVADLIVALKHLPQRNLQALSPLLLVKAENLLAEAARDEAQLRARLIRSVVDARVYDDAIEMAERLLVDDAAIGAPILKDLLGVVASPEDASRIRDSIRHAAADEMENVALLVVWAEMGGEPVIAELHARAASTEDPDKALAALAALVRLLPPAESAVLFDYFGETPVKNRELLLETVQLVLLKDYQAGRVSAEWLADSVLSDIALMQDTLGAGPEVELRFKMLEAIGPSAQLAEAAIERVQRQPWSRAAHEALFSDQLYDFLDHDRLAFIHFHNYLQRAPREAARLLAFGRHHLRNNGHAIVAQAQAAQIALWHPNLDDRSLLGEIYAKSDDFAGVYNAMFAGQTQVRPTIGARDLFDSIRSNAHIVGGGGVIQYDIATLTALELEDGYVVGSISHDPRTGLPTRFEKYGFAGAANYDANGLPIHLQYQGLLDMRVTYGAFGPSQSDHLPLSIDQPGFATLSYERGADGAVLRATIKDLGSVSYSQVLGQEPAIDPVPGVTVDELQDKIRQTESLLSDMHVILRIFRGDNNIGQDVDRLSRSIRDRLDPDAHLTEVSLVLDFNEEFLEEEFGEEEDNEEPVSNRLRAEWAYREGLLSAQEATQFAVDLFRERWEQMHTNRHMFYWMEVSNTNLGGQARRFGIYDNPDAILWAKAYIEVLGLWRDYLKLGYPNGLDEHYWGNWAEIITWLNHLDQYTENVELLRLRDARLVDLLNDAPHVQNEPSWIAESDLGTPARWRNWRKSDVFPSRLITESFVTRDILIRNNDDVVVASNRGISVYRQGYWQWFGYDEGAGGFSRNVEFDQLSGYSNIHALAEADNGSLYLATHAGLIVLAEDYETPIAVMPSGKGGLPAGALRALAFSPSPWMLDVEGNSRKPKDLEIGIEGLIAVGGDAGLSLIWVRDRTVQPWSDAPVEKLKKGGVLYPNGESRFHILRADRMTAILDRFGALSEEVITDYHVEDITVDHGLNLLVAGRLMQRVFTDVPMHSRDAEGDLIYHHESVATIQPVPNQSDILAYGRPRGLLDVDLRSNDWVNIVLTDRGASARKGRRFEPLTVPHLATSTGISDGAHARGKTFLITDHGVSAIGLEQVLLIERGGGYRNALVLSPEGNSVFAAVGTGIIEASPETTGWEFHRRHSFVDNFRSRLRGLKQTFLRRGPEGRYLYASGLSPNWEDEGRVVLSVDLITNKTESLFVAPPPALPVYLPQQLVRDALYDREGRHWILTDTSLFLIESPEAAPVEFSHLRDPIMFPIRANRLHALLEDPEGHILVVARSEEAKGTTVQELEGGVVIYRNGRFERIALTEGDGWLISALTPIGNGEAIAATNHGFARYYNLALHPFSGEEAETYRELVASHPMLWNGTQGAVLRDDVYLFGTAGGVVGRAMGRWFYPDKLNQLLPQDENALYASQGVDDLIVDKLGRIYVSTKGFLTILVSETGAPETLLLNKGSTDLLWVAQEKDRIRGVNEILLEALPRDSLEGRRLQEMEDSSRELARLETALAESGSAAERDKLERQLLRSRQRDLGLLGRIEQENPNLFSLLQLNPVDLRALAPKLPQDNYIAQFLMTPQTLYINLVSRNGEHLREVSVSASEITFRVRRLAERMAAQARGTLRAFDLGGPQLASGAPVMPENGNPTLEDQLWLYEHLLRPIEHDIPEGATLVVSPEGVLSYLAFGALIRDEAAGEARPEYAIDRFAISVAPSLFALSSLIDARPSLAMSTVIFGDPDGSLPFARAEAEELAQHLGEIEDVVLKTGEAASYEALLDHGTDARILHLATHGKLDPLTPSESYLLLAEGHRMNMAQLMTLPLAETELVFLSACETGLGSDGLEYRTLSHALIHAGAQSVLATLWQVDDAAMRALARDFYTAKMGGMSHAQALATAQRNMLGRGGDLANPGYWAGVILLGS